MIYFELIREHFQALGISLFKCDRLAAVKATTTFLIYIVLAGPYCICMSGAFIILHLKDLQNATIALTHIVACVSCTAELLFFKFSQANIGKLILNFQEFIDNGEWNIWKNMANVANIYIFILFQWKFINFSACQIPEAIRK